MTEQLTYDHLRIDLEKEAERICVQIRKMVYETLGKRGAVVGVSGGIDSAAVTALCARALGPQRVVALLMPDQHSSPETLAISRSVPEAFGIKYEHEDITTSLLGLRCYERQDEAIRSVIPEYGPGWKSKIVLPSVVDDARYRLFSIIALSPNGQEIRRRLTPAAYLGILAATNFKQRVRTIFEYYHADLHNYAVAGTPNLLEYDQGFFVKGGDGLADFKPIAHLYKTQVYQMAEHLGVPATVCSRPPTTDTYSLPQGQDEFYFSLPYQAMDLCLYAKNHGFVPAALVDTLKLSEEQIARVFADIDNKRRVTAYLHLPALTLLSDH
jgi:NAD+ synthase